LAFYINKLTNLISTPGAIQADYLFSFFLQYSPSRRSHPFTSHLPDIPPALFALFISLLPADERDVPANFERLARRLVYYFVSDHCFCSFAGKQKSAENIA